MKNFRTASIIFVLSVVTFNSFGQQEAQFTQYMDNTLHINPAYAGSKGVMNMIGVHREQWTGFDGHPRSSTFSFQSPLRYRSVGLGFTFVNDQAGPVSQNMFYGDFAYSFKLNKKDHKLSFGIKGGINLINVKSAELVVVEGNDPKFSNNVRNKVNPNFGAGIYYHTPFLFAGISVPKILETSYDPLSARDIEQRHYYGIIGGVIKVSNHWKLRPTGQVKVAIGAPISIDASLAGIYMDKLYIGAMYRWDAAVGIFFQYQLTQQFKLGLATEMGTQQIRKYNYGTYELMLSYDFVFKNHGIRSPRYF